MKNIFKLAAILFVFSYMCECLSKRELESQQSKHWGYRNEDKSLLPHHWHKSHPKCHGKAQSPIDILFYQTVFNSSLSPIEIRATDEPEAWEVKNNGHSVVFTPLNNKEFSFVMQPEAEQYKLLQMHFHWRGSEHFVNGRKFAGELHMVHQSKVDENKLAVLGFFIEQVNNDNPVMQPFVSQIFNVVKHKQTVETAELKLNDIIPTKLSKYFRYSGSLTTPTCDEIVEWFVMDGPVLTLSEEQLLDFQALEDAQGYPILKNSRPVQILNDRLVLRSFYDANVFRNKGYLNSASGYNNANSLSKTNNARLFLFGLFVSLFYIYF